MMNTETQIDCVVDDIREVYRVLQNLKKTKASFLVVKSRPQVQNILSIRTCFITDYAPAHFKVLLGSGATYRVDVQMQVGNTIMTKSRFVKSISDVEEIYKGYIISQTLPNSFRADEMPSVFEQSDFAKPMQYYKTFDEFPSGQKEQMLDINARNPYEDSPFDKADKQITMKKKLHNGVSPIVVPSGKWYEQYDALWVLLVPLMGSAPTMQGEAIRISGKITREIKGISDSFWDNASRKMLDALVKYFAEGTPLLRNELEEATKIFFANGGTI
jgi:hypothetical protein